MQGGRKAIDGWSNRKGSKPQYYIIGTSLKIWYIIIVLSYRFQISSNKMIINRVYKL